MEYFYFLLSNLIIAHIIGDFYLQFNCFCQNKILKNYKGWALYVHACIIFVLTWLAIMEWGGWYVALAIAICHLLIDCAKSKLSIMFKIMKIDKKDDKHVAVSGDNKRYDILAFSVDQILHVVIIVIGTWFYLKHCNSSWEEPFIIKEVLKNHATAISLFIGLILVMRPANMFVILILDAFKVNILPENHGNFRSGALIGCLERVLILVFVLVSQYEAIGFLVAAKSILRFKDSVGPEIGESKGEVDIQTKNSDYETEKSEYVIAGTLLSLTISLFVGLAIIKFFIPLLNGGKSYAN